MFHHNYFTTNFSQDLSSFTSLTILTNIQFLQTLSNVSLDPRHLEWILHKFTRIHNKVFRYAFLIRWILFLFIYWISRYCDCQSLPGWQAIIWFTSIVKFFSSFSYYSTPLLGLTVSFIYSIWASFEHYLLHFNSIWFFHSLNYYVLFKLRLLLSFYYEFSNQIQILLSFHPKN